MADEHAQAIHRQALTWLPIAVSLLQLALIGWALASGVVSGGDEGVPARVFQSLLIVQLLVILAFAARWVPRAPARALIVLAAQLISAAVPVATILVLES